MTYMQEIIFKRSVYKFFFGLSLSKWFKILSKGYAIPIAIVKFAYSLTIMNIFMKSILYIYRILLLCDKQY